MRINFTAMNLIYSMNCVLGTIPIIRKINEKFTIVHEKIRKIYITLLLIVTVYCFFDDEHTISKFTNIKSGFDLNFILYTTAIITTFSTTIICWIESMILKEYYMKVIKNNAMIHKSLSKKKGGGKFPLGSIDVFLLIFFVNICFVCSVYYIFNFRPDESTTEIWHHIMILIFDLYVIMYIAQQKLNTFNLKLLNVALNKVHNVHLFSESDMSEIAIIFDKLCENANLINYLLSFPVNE